MLPNNNNHNEAQGNHIKEGENEVRDQMHSTKGKKTQAIWSFGVLYNQLFLAIGVKESRIHPTMSVHIHPNVKTSVRVRTLLSFFDTTMSIRSPFIFEYSYQLFYLSSIYRHEMVSNHGL